MRKPVVLRLAALDSSPEDERLNRDGEQTAHKEGGANARQADDGSGEEIDFASRTDSMLFTNFAYPTLSQKTLAIIRTARAAPARGCSTRLSTRLWRIATTARTCLIFRSGWGRQRRSWSEISSIRATRGTSAWGAAAVGFFFGGNMGLDVVREFTPELARKLHLPFRYTHDLPKKRVPDTSPAD